MLRFSKIRKREDGYFSLRIMFPDGSSQGVVAEDRQTLIDEQARLMKAYEKIQ